MTEEKIWSALASVQAQLRTQPHTREVSVGKYSYTYTELSALCDYLLPILSAAGIATTYTSAEAGSSSLRIACRLTAADGSHVEASTIIAPDGPDAQSVGKVLTYGRRYCLQMATGIATESDTDCAPSEAAHKPVQKAQQSSGRLVPPAQQNGQQTGAQGATAQADPNAASEPQRRKLWARINELCEPEGIKGKESIKDILDSVCTRLAGIRASQLNRKQASQVIEWLDSAKFESLHDDIPF